MRESIRAQVLEIAFIGDDPDPGMQSALIAAD